MSKFDDIPNQRKSVEDANRKTGPENYEGKHSPKGGKDGRQEAGKEGRS